MRVVRRNPNAAHRSCIHYLTSLLTLTALLCAPGATAGTAVSAWLTSPLLIQSANTGNASPSPVNTFPAISPASSTPPDSHGAVGPNHVLTQTNDSSRVHDRNGTQLTSVGIKGFWSGLGVTDVFDPKVVYEPYSDRFVAVACAQRRSSASGMLFGVSETSDPTGNWHLWLLDADSTNSDWVDFPNLGFVQGRLTITGNLFTISADGFSGVNIWVIDTASALDGGALTMELLRITNAGGTLVPPLTYDAAETTQHLVRTGTANIFGSGRLQMYNITGNIGALSFNTNPTASVGDAWSISVPNAKQMGTSALIETNDTRLLSAVIRNGRLWTAHTVALSITVRDHAAVKWWEIDPATGTVIQDGAIEDVDGSGNFDVNTGTHYYFPSVAINKNDEVLIGFSGSSGQEFVSSYYAFRAPTYPEGQFDIPTRYFSGVGTYSGPRWGDYSHTVVDPVDDTTFWTVQQHAAGGNRGGNSWAQVGEASADTTPPGISDLDAVTATRFIVTFSEPMADNTALVSASSYSFSPSLSIVSVVRLNSTQVRINTAEVTTGTGYTLTVSGLSDLAGNILNGSSMISGTGVLGDPPTAVITLNTGNPTNANTVVFGVEFSESVGTTFTASDVTVTGSLSSGATKSVSGSAGSYTVSVTPSNPNGEGMLGINLGTGISDLAGNTFSGGSSPQSYTVDNTAPSISVASLLTTDTTPPLSGTVNDNAATISIAVGGQTRTATNNGNGTWTLANNSLSTLSNGTYNVVATASDAAGNSSTDSTTNELTIDSTVPVVTVNTLLTNDKTPPLTGTVNETDATISVSVGGQTRTATNNGNGTWTLPDGSLSTLSDGTYNVAVTATDGIGNAGTDGTNNELTIDTAAPVVSVASKVTNDTRPPLNGNVSDLTTAVTVSVGGQTRSATNNGNGTWTLADNAINPALSAGTYNVVVTSTDMAGNTGTDSSSNELTIDLTAPNVTVNSRVTNDTTPALTGTVNDMSATISVAVGGQTKSATNNGNGTWTLANNAISPALAAGTYNVVVTATDTAGNAGTDSSSNELTIDTTAPAVTVNALANPTNDNTPPLSGTINDNNATISIAVGGQTRSATNNGNGTWSLANGALSTLADNTYNVVATATDTAGNVGTDSTSGELTVDTQAPTVTITSLSTNDRTPPLSGAVNDTMATISVSVGGTNYGATNNGNGTWTLANNTISSLSDGTYNITVTATDKAGNSGADATANELTIDATAPLVTVNTLLTSDSRPPLSGSVNDTAATIAVSVDGQNRTGINNGNGTWTLSDNALSPLSNGTYNVVVTATDGASNAGTDSTTNELTVDTIAPTITVTSKTTNDPTPSLAGTVNDNSATISIAVGGQTRSATNNGNGTWTLADGALSSLAAGTYNVVATATDGATNVGTDSTSNELVVDTTGPSITVNTLVTNDKTPALTGTVDDAVSTISVTVAGQTRSATNNGDGTWTLADNALNSLVEGTFNVVATATDGPGNVGTDGTTNELTVDSIPPVITVDSLTTLDTRPPLSGTVSENGATIAISVGGQNRTATNNNDGTWTLINNSINPALADDTYDVSATATDAAGNVGVDDTTDELVVDNTAPLVTVNSLSTNDARPQLTGGVDDATAEVRVTVDAQANLLATNNGNGTWTLPDNTINPGLSTGTYNVAVTATDSLGNAGSDSTTNELSVDSTAPTVSITPLLTNDTRPGLSGAVDDALATISVSVAGQNRAATNNGDGTWTLANNAINPALSQGTYNVAVTATDPAGNSTTDNTNAELTIDTTAPVITVDSLTTSDSRPPLSGTVNDINATIAITVGGQNRIPTNNGDGTWTLADNAFTPLADNTYDVAVRATDAAGNEGADASTNELIVDTEDPIITVDVLNTADSRPPLTGTVNDNGATINVVVSGQSHSATNDGDGTWTLADNAITALPDNTYNVAATATDAAGNSGSDASTNELTIDTVGPMVTVNSLVTGDNRPALSGNINDTSATVSVSVGGQTRAGTNNGDGTWTLADNAISPGLADNTYNVAVTATDSLGNVGTDGSTNELRIDTTLNVSVIALTTSDSTPALNGTVDDTTATISVQVNSNTYPGTNNGNGTWALADNIIAPALTDGTYNVTVTATDSLGNVATDGTTNELTVDGSVPTITVNSLSTMDTRPPLTGTVSNVGATILVDVGGQVNLSATNNGDGTWTLADNLIDPGLNDGTYDVLARATTSGTGTDSTANELVIDTTPPVVTIDSLITSDRRPPLSGTVDDLTATILVDVGAQAGLAATNNGDGTWTLANDVISPNLAAGTYDVVVTATDSIGNADTDGTTNELVIDLVAPTITITSISTNDTTPALSGTVDDNSATIAIDVGGQTNLVAVNNGDSSWTLADNAISPLTPNVYNVVARATDVAGNVGTDGSTGELTLDTTGPTVTVATLSTVDSTPALSGTIDDASATISVTVGGQTNAATNNGATWTLADNVLTTLGDGVYNVMVTATDTVGNAGSDSSTNELRIDTTAPVVTVDTLATADTRPQLTGTVNDVSATVSIDVGGQTGLVATNTGNGIWVLADDQIAPALADGTYNVVATATDVLGNSGSDATTNELSITTVALVITVTPLTTNDTTPALEGSVSDPAATISVVVNGQTYEATNDADGTWSLADGVISPALSQGNYSVIATATSTASVVGTDGTNNELTIDVTAPTVTILTIFTTDSRPELTGTVNDPTATVRVDVGGQTNLAATNNGDGSWTLADDVISPDLAQGSYFVTARATDGAGNVGTKGLANKLHVDTTPPVVVVNTLSTTDNTPGLSGTVTDNILTSTIEVWVTVDGQTNKALRSGSDWFLENGQLTTLADATYDVSVTGTDRAGNVGTDGTSNELIVDTTAPDISVNTLATSDSTPALTGSVNDMTAEVRISVGGQSNVLATNNGDGTWTLADNTLSTLSDGTYAVVAQATDTLGNVGVDATNDELTIDATAPVVTVSALLTNDSTPPLSGTVNDTTATISVLVNGNSHGATNNGNGTWTLANNTITPALSSGTYNVTVSAMDARGNVGTDGTTSELTVDLVAPAITVTTFVSNDSTPPLSGTIDDPTASIRVDVGTQTDISATNNGSGTWTLPDGTLSALADGVYDVVARAVDTAGNMGTDATSNELTVNTQAPTVTVNTLATTDNTPSLTGTISRPDATIEVTVAGQTNTATNNGDGSWTLANDVLSPLADGLYNILALARDPQDNTSNDATQDELRIDTTAPIVTINALQTNDNRPPLTGSVNDTTATIRVDVNGQINLAATNNGDGSWTLPDNAMAILPDNAGGYDVVVRATDTLGNEGTDSSTNELIIDTVAPVVTVNSLTTAEVSPQLTGMVDDTSATVQVTLGLETVSATNNSNGTWTLAGGTLSPLDSGVYDVMVTATDGAANAASDGTTDELEVDTIPPTITVNPIVTTDTTPPLSGTVSEASAVINVNLAGTDFPATNNGDGTWTIADGVVGPLVDGQYDVNATATDVLGNVGSDTSNGELNIDTSGPIVTVNALVTNDTTPALTGTINESGVNLVVTVAGNDYNATNNGDGTWTLSNDSIAPPLAEGSYDVAVVATDALGNMGADTTVDELTIDVTVPVVTITPQLTTLESPALAGTVNDPTAGIFVTVNSTTYTAANIGNGTWSLVAGQIVALSSGVYDVIVQAQDPAGNLATDDTTDELTVDLDVPEVTVDVLVTNDNTPPLTGTIDDDTAVIEVTVDGQTNTATNNGDGTWTLADDILQPLDDGVYNVTAVATDTAGNASTDPSLVDDLFVITSAPNITVNPLTTSDTTPQLNGSVNQPSSTIRVTVDGQTHDATNNGDGTWTLANDTLTALAEGTYDVDVRGVDLLGNEGADITTNELTIDLSVPFLTVNTRKTRDRTPALTGTIDDPDAIVTISVAGQTHPATNNGDGTWTLADNTLSTLDDGVYDVSATANGANDSTISELVIDTVGPIVVLGEPTVTQNKTVLDALATREGPITFQVQYMGASLVALLQNDVEIFALLDANPTVLKSFTAGSAKTFPISTGTATGNIVISGTGNTTRTVTITDVTGDGFLGIAIIAGTALDDVGNPASSAVATQLVFVDNTAPEVISLGVVDQAIVDVRFSESLGATVAPENFSLSGPGLGTLTASPDNVALVEPGRYRLMWNSGSLLNGQEITVAVAGVLDAVGNPIGDDNSATAFVEGIGVSPTVADVKVVEGRAVSVRFSEPIAVGALDVLNYVVSGSGRGTLPENPTSISELPLNDPDNPEVLITGNRNGYLLTWTEGEMLQGGDITITVTGVEDNTGNPLTAPGNGTASGAGIGTAPRLSSVSVPTGKTVEVVFNEALGAGADDPANFQLSGAGQGTLTAQPDSVAPNGSGRYVLTWNVGEMLNGGDLTITVTNVTDAAGNPIGDQNTATATKAGRDGLITVNIPARRDVTLYEDTEGALANGAGTTFFVGNNSEDLRRRGVLLFDVVGNIPQGSIVVDSTLKLTQAGTVGDATAQNYGLHPVVSEWFEGAVDAGDPGADGAPSEDGEATWIHREFDTTPWTTPGGDFDPTAHATTSVAGPGDYTWADDLMDVDVQTWLDDGDNNFGWLLLGNESQADTVKGFRSDEHGPLAERPRLQVIFSLNGGPGGPTLGTIGDQSVEEGETLTLALTANDTDSNPLAISAPLANLPLGANAVLTDNGNGTAAFSWTPGFLDSGSYVLTFIATQVGPADPLSISESIVITVTEVNQVPVLQPFEPATATEGQPFTVTAVAEDSDADDIHTFSLVVPVSGVSIDSTSGELTWTPGFSDAGDYQIGVRVTDNGSPPRSDQETLSIAVQDANGPPAIVAPGPQTVVEAEVLSFKIDATDPDLDDALTFSLENSPAGSTIDPATGVFRWTPSIAAAGDHEATVRVTDDGDPPMSTSVTLQITVIDDNRDPTAITLSPSSVAENTSTGSLVGMLTTTDPDGGDVHSYTLVAGTGDGDNSQFVIDGAEVRTNATFDFESRSSYSIRVRSFDGKDGSIEMPLTISIVDGNDLPTALGLSNTDVMENTALGTVVGVLTTTDQDVADQHVYSLVSGDGDADNGLFAITGRNLVVNGGIDFEMQTALSIRIRSEDRGGAFVESSFVLTVSNENDLANGVTLTATEVAENAPVATEVGRFMTNDDDGGSQTYRLVSGEGSTNNNDFRIVDDVLQTARVLDFEMGRMRSIRVRSIDAEQGSFEMNFTIQVLDANDPPTDLAIDAGGILGNVPEDTVIGALITTDQDLEDAHTYALVAGEGDTNNSSFRVADRQLIAAEAINFNSIETFSVRLQTTDQAGATFEKSFVLTNDDTDGDGLSDLWELLHFGNLLMAADADSDGDGLTNLEEFQLGTVPTLGDSDGDGVLDGDEVINGTNPTNSADAPAILNVSPTTATRGREESTVTIQVRNTGLAVLDWQAEVVSGNFAQITTGPSGQNAGEVEVLLASNGSSSARNATIRITAAGTVGSPIDVVITQSACSAPNVPSDVLATNGSLPGQVRVLWDGVAEAEQYMVFRSLGTDPDAADLIGTVVGTAFTDTTAPFLDDSKQTTDAGGGCLPILGPDPTPSTNAYQYWVRAMNVCGTSAFSTPDDGFPGAGTPPEMALFEPVLPGFETDTRALRVREDSVLAIRLSQDTAIDPGTIRGEVDRNGVIDTDVTWRAIDTVGLRDGWVRYHPGENLFEEGETVIFTVTASTVSGEAIGPLTYRFTVETEGELLDRIGASAEAIFQPTYQDFDATGIDLSLENQSELTVYALTEVPAGLANATGPAYAFVPDELYDLRQRVWLPLAEGQRIDDVVVNYYFADKTGARSGWYPADQIVGWSDMSTYLELEVDGVRYIGFTARHGALVQLSTMSAKRASVSAAGSMPTTLERVGGDGIVFMLLLFGMVLVVPRMKVWRPKSN